MKKSVLFFISVLILSFVFTGCVSSTKNMVSYDNGKVYYVSEAECTVKDIKDDNTLICKDKDGKATTHKPMSKEAMQLQMHKEKIRAIRSSNMNNYNYFCGYRRFCY